VIGPTANRGADLLHLSSAAAGLLLGGRPAVAESLGEGDVAAGIGLDRLEAELQPDPNPALLESTGVFTTSTRQDERFYDASF